MGYNSPGKSPFEEVIINPTIVWPQTQLQGGNTAPSLKENWIKDLLSMAPPQKRQCQRMLKVKSLSRVRLFATLWTVAHQAPLSMKQISFRKRQESQLIYFKS